MLSRRDTLFLFRANEENIFHKKKNECAYLFSFYYIDKQVFGENCSVNTFRKYLNIQRCRENTLFGLRSM